MRDKARVLSRDNTYCRVLYRNKSPQYFSDVFTKNAGVMKVYVKDNSGDQASPINGQINGNGDSRKPQSIDSRRIAYLVLTDGKY